MVHLGSFWCPETHAGHRHSGLLYRATTCSLAATPAYSEVAYSALLDAISSLGSSGRVARSPPAAASSTVQSQDADGPSMVDEWDIPSGDMRELDRIISRELSTRVAGLFRLVW